MVNPLNYFYILKFCHSSSIIIKMAKQLIVVSLLLLSAFAMMNQGAFATCPSGGVNAIAGKLTISSNGPVPLQTNNDIQCYNHTLETPFDCAPSIAIGVTHLESKPSNSLFFSIKTVNSDSNGVIPFIVRTHWGYTRWSKITFFFLAEASDLIQAGYYQVDTATLSACMSGKQIVAFIPTPCKSSHWKALTFLNGFEVTSVNPKGTFFTPYEVQVVVKSVSTQGLTLLVSTTSATQIHSIFIAYIAYDPSIKNLHATDVLYDKYVGTNSNQNVMAADPSVYLMFCGVSSFIIGNNGGNFGLSISSNDKGTIANSISKFYYLSYGEFMLGGGKCGQCIGYSIYHGEKCVASCPPAYYYDGMKCVTCAAGQVWNGKACVAKPVTPVTPVNPVNPKPVPSCPRGTYWEQQQLRCLPCPSGCSSCPDCYSCDSCSLGFFLGAGNPLCQETCGDGKKFVSDCDDGNKINGDGCSNTCEVEKGFTCTGGSPYSKDSCHRGLPAAITFKSSGQSHVWGKIIINIKLNYLPQALIDSAVDCKNRCNQVLSAKIVSGDISAVSILAQYIPNSRYSFSVEVNFAKEPIGMFTLQVGVRPSLASKYFGGIDASKTLNVNVNPSFFNAHQNEDLILA